MIIPKDTQNFIDRVEGDLVYLTIEGQRKVMIYARNCKLRGASTKSRRIRKKVSNKAFNLLIGVIIKEISNEQI